MRDWWQAYIHWRQDSAIDAAAKDAADARFYGDLALKDIDALRAQALEQRRQIGDLATMMSVLIKMLGESGALDTTVLRYRVEAEIEARIEAAKPTNRKLECRICKQQIVAALTQMTEDGTVCDMCIATRGT